jgi:hypothetical protein
MQSLAQANKGISHLERVSADLVRRSCEACNEELAQVCSGEHEKGEVGNCRLMWSFRSQFSLICGASPGRRMIVRRLLWGATTDWGPVPGCCAIRTRLALPRKYDPKSSVIYSLAKGQAISRMPAVPQSGVGREPEDHAIFAIAWSNRKLLLDRTCKIHRASRTGGTCSVASASVEGQRSSCSTI